MNIVKRAIESSDARPITSMRLEDVPCVLLKELRDALMLFGHMLRLIDGDLEILTASSGAEALEKLRIDRPDHMLLDIVMPDMDGWQVLQAQSQDDAISDIPVTIVSAQDIHDQPMASRFIVAAMGEGISITKLLDCSHAMAARLLRPD